MYRVVRRYASWADFGRWDRMIPEYEPIHPQGMGYLQSINPRTPTISQGGMGRLRQLEDYQRRPAWHAEPALEPTRFGNKLYPGPVRGEFNRRPWSANKQLNPDTDEYHMVKPLGNMRYMPKSQFNQPGGIEGADPSPDDPAGLGARTMAPMYRTLIPKQPNPEANRIFGYTPPTQQRYNPETGNRPFGTLWSF